MKPFTILLTACLLIGTQGFTQKIYIRAGGGIAASIGSDYVYDYSTSSSGYTLTTKKQGIGTGLPFVVAGGFNINSYFAIELGVNYFFGFQLKRTMVSTYVSSSYLSSYDHKWNGQMLSIVPAFVMTLPLNKFKPYSRLGLQLGVMNNITTKNHNIYNTEFQSTTLNEVQSEQKDYGGIAIGVQAAVGTNFVISDLISLFGEIQIDGISYSPLHGKYTRYIQNGSDILNNRTTKQNTWDYKKEITFPNTIPDDQPNEQSRVSYQFSNVGLLVGVKISF